MEQVQGQQQIWQVMLICIKQPQWVRWLPSVIIYFIWPKMTIIYNLWQSHNSEIHVQGIVFCAVPDNDSALICGRTSSAEIISKHIPMYLWTLADNKCRADSRLAPSQWVMSLQSNAISDWLDTNLESALKWPLTTFKNSWCHCFHPQITLTVLNSSK